MALLLVILGFGLRSLRVIVATLCALVLSLTTTTAWAMWSVGEFNTISAGFSILLIGLGVDFGVHIGLRYEESLAKGLSVQEALEDAVSHTAAPISLCALTSAIGFASFVPTEFRGLAGLGVIASGGMLMALVASYTVLPAVLALTRPRLSRIGTTGGPWRALHETIGRRALSIGQRARGPGGQALRTGANELSPGVGSLSRTAAENLARALAPITLAAFFTIAFGALTHFPFNIANVLAVPLVLGLGVDSGIHVFMRFREDGSLTHAIESTTPWAVSC